MLAIDTLTKQVTDLQAQLKQKEETQTPADTTTDAAATTTDEQAKTDEQEKSDEQTEALNKQIADLTTQLNNLQKSRSPGNAISEVSKTIEKNSDATWLIGDFNSAHNKSVRAALKQKSIEAVTGK
jgi:hypothetical protein